MEDTFIELKQKYNVSEKHLQRSYVVEYNLLEKLGLAVLAFSGGVTLFVMCCMCYKFSCKGKLYDCISEPHNSHDRRYNTVPTRTGSRAFEMKPQYAQNRLAIASGKIGHSRQSIAGPVDTIELERIQ